MSFLLKTLLIMGLFIFQTVLQQAAHEKPVLLLNATAHLGHGKQIDNAAVAFQNGRLTMVADATRIRLDMSAFQVKKVFGKHIYAAVVADRDSLAAGNNRFFAPLDSAGLMVDLSAYTLEEGKEATLVVTDRALGREKEPAILMTYIKGKQVTSPAKHIKPIK